MTAEPAYLDGVRSQPENLRRSAAVVREALADGPVVPMRRPGRILVLGMGASAAAATGFASVLRAAGRPALAADPADLLDAAPAGLADTYLAVSQSGRSAETVAVMSTVDAGRRVALTNDPGSPLAAVADAVLPLGCGADTRVSTLSYTATLQALGLLAEALDSREPRDWTAVPDAAAAVLSGVGADAIADRLSGVSTVDVVGGGVRVASALAAALLLREAAHLPTAGFPTREYLHGHLETAGPGRGALLFGAGRELALAADLAGYGASVVLVTDATGELPAHPNLHAVRLPALAGLAGCVLDILPVQLAAAALAERAGRPVELRHMPPDTKLPPPP